MENLVWHLYAEGITYLDIFMVRAKYSPHNVKFYVEFVFFYTLVCCD